jgi:hypothetical protein
VVKVEGFDEADVYPSDEVEAHGFGPNSSGPSGFPPLDRLGRRTSALSGGFVRWVNIGLATFRVDCLAIRQTELRPICHKMLS